MFDDAAITGKFSATSTLSSFRPKTGRITALARRPGWPLLPLPPAIVVAVGLAVALAIGIVGIDQFSRTSDERAAEQATLLIASLSARLPMLPAARRLPLLQQAAHMSDAEFLVVDGTGSVLLRVTDEAPDEATLRQAVALGQGDATTSAGPTKFAARALSPPMGGQALIAFVPASYASERARPFVAALLALTILLLGVASAVASAVARDAIRDVEFVTVRVAEMADKTRLETSTTWVPLRAFDEVGILTSAFNDLVARFAASEKSYLVDLDRASEADRDRAAFLAAVSHELRSPLNAVLGFADILLAEVDGPLTAEQREEVEQIRDSGQHLLELISDILEFSALETGQLKLSRSPTDLTALAQEVTREQAVRLKDKPVVLRVEGAPGVMGDVDARRVRQVITNLVGNAIKFTQQGEIVVKVTAAPRFVSLSVIDTGPGIDSDERAMIFEEYKQAHGERAHKRGTGLGLAIARRLVLLHSGTIQLESELGRGSKFHVYLPLWRGPSPGSSPRSLHTPTPPPPAAASGSGKRGAVS